MSDVTSEYRQQNVTATEINLFEKLKNPENDNSTPRSSAKFDITRSLSRCTSAKSKAVDRTLFTFKPKLNPKSKVLAENFLNFYERQNIHTQKQLEMVSGLFTS